jgi:hypothetical protein
MRSRVAADAELVDLDVATAEVAPVEGADGVGRGALFLHLDEGEAARAARLTVRDDGDGLDATVSTEGFLEVFFGAGEREVSYVKLLAH